MVLTDIKAVYLDRGFYDSKCLTLLQAHNYAYVVPIVRWRNTIKQKLSEGWSRVIQYDLTEKLDGPAVTVEFPVYVDCTYLNGRYDENGMARHGYAADSDSSNINQCRSATIDDSSRQNRWLRPG